VNSLVLEKTTTKSKLLFQLEESSKVKLGWIKFTSNLLNNDTILQTFLVTWKVPNIKQEEEKVPLCICLLVQKVLQEVFGILKKSPSGVQKKGIFCIVLSHCLDLQHYVTNLFDTPPQSTSKQNLLQLVSIRLTTDAIKQIQV
jgi:hypothetical protein